MIHDNEVNKLTLCSIAIGNTLKYLGPFSPVDSLKEANRLQGQHRLLDITYLDALVTAEVPAKGLHSGKV